VTKTDLFDHVTDAPLAERMRPCALHEVVGHPHLTTAQGPLRKALESSRPPSLILWGPPGCGKTTLARLIAHQVKARFVALSAVLSGVAQVREVISRAREEHRRGRKTLLFVDEIHRFNKAQQDAFLPHVESGLICLIGATTENPSFALNNALLSRCKVIVLKPLGVDELITVLERALCSPKGYGQLDVHIEPTALKTLSQYADGDARRALNALEAVISPQLESTNRVEVTSSKLDELNAEGGLRYNRGGDDYFHIISALIKSLRGSDPDAGLYWLARLLEAGEDPRSIARRLIVFAAEDIGNADPRALQLAVAAAQAHEMIGMPESRIPLAQAVTFLATAPKSDASYQGLKKAMEAVATQGALPVPMRLRNPSTTLGRKLGYGQGYNNPHRAGGFVAEVYLPDDLASQSWYDPSGNGYEAQIRQRLLTWQRLRESGQSVPLRDDDTA